MTYEVVFDAGKPWSEWFEDEEGLYEALKAYYEYHKNHDDYYNATVYNEAGEDISESQFVQEIIGRILEEDEE